MAQATNITEIRRAMDAIVADARIGNSDVVDHRVGDPDLNFIVLTRLAEEAAHELGHDEWLDDETHPVWELAIEVAERSPG